MKIDLNKKAAFASNYKQNSERKIGMKRVKRLILILLVLAFAAGVIAVSRKDRSAEVMHSGATFVCSAAGTDHAV